MSNLRDYTQEIEDDFLIEQYQISLKEHFLPNIDTLCMYYRYVIQELYEKKKESYINGRK